MARIPGPNNVIATVQQLGQNLEEITRKTLYSAVIGRGGITIDGTGGIQVSNGTGTQFYVGGGFSAPAHADGSPQVISLIGDEAGRDRLVLWDPTVPANPANQVFFEWDQFGHLIRSGDRNGGWATPWFSVPMYSRFSSNGAPAAYSSAGYYFGGGVRSFTAGTNNCANGNDYWEGRIPFVSHPNIAVCGVWSNANFSVTVNGTTVGTWTGTGTGSQTFGPFDISGVLGQTDIKVQIIASGMTNGATVACDCLGVYLRQT